MSSKKQKKKGPRHKKKAQKSGFNVVKLIREWFKERHPVLKFLLGFLACLVVFYLFYYSSFYKNYLELPFLNAQAVSGHALLSLLGYETSVSDTVIAGSNFSVDIKSGCDGLEAIAIFISGLLIFPAPIRLKLTGLVWGVGILLILNILRIAGLYLAGIHFSEAVFDILHIQGGFIIFTMISVLILFIWMNWSLKKVQKTQT